MLSSKQRATKVYKSLSPVAQQIVRRAMRLANKRKFDYAIVAFECDARMHGFPLNELEKKVLRQPKDPEQFRRQILAFAGLERV
jgi:hypothetical protein